MHGNTPNGVMDSIAHRLHMGSLTAHFCDWPFTFQVCRLHCSETFSLLDPPLGCFYDSKETLKWLLLPSLIGEIQSAMVCFS